MIPALLPSGTRALVLNVAPFSKKEPLPTIGHLMANSIVSPAVNLSTGNSSQLQLMKKFTKISEIHLPTDHYFIFNPARHSLAFFYVLSPNDDLFVLQTFIYLI
jgi:hypothetical protein